MLKNIKIAYFIIVYLVFIVLIGIAFHKYKLLNIISQTRLNDLIILSLIGLTIIGLLSLQLWITLKIFCVRLSYFSSWALSSMNSLFNYVLPAKTGTVFKGIILKNKYGLLYSNYISLLFITNLMVLFSGFILFLVFAISYNHINFQGCVLLICIVLLVVVSIYFFEKKKLRINISLNIGYIKKINEGIRICFKNERKILAILILNYFVIFLSALRLYWCFKYLGGNIKLLQVIYMQILTSLSLLFSITPANIFVKEGIIIAVGNAFLINSEVAIAAALLDRAASIASIIIAVVISLPKYKTEMKFVRRNPH